MGRREISSCNSDPGAPDWTLNEGRFIVVLAQYSANAVESSATLYITTNHITILPNFHLFCMAFLEHLQIRRLSSQFQQC